jgi:CheY-like chemotaxis protein
VLADAQRIKQVLLNLVGNAIKFTENGTVTLRMGSRRTDGESALVHFEVQDSGIGIPAEGARRPLPAVSSSRGQAESRPEGTGLGLAISQHIVRAMGGRIDVTSAVGKGSVFAFDVALRFDPAFVPPSADDSAPVELDGEGTLSGRVLVVEDNEVNRMIAREVLFSLGLDVVEAGDGREAIAVPRRGGRRPGPDGLRDARDDRATEATIAIRGKEAKAGRARLPIVALTANAFDEDAAKSRTAGMDGHLAKPYTREQLREVLAGGDSFRATIRH